MNRLMLQVDTNIELSSVILSEENKQKIDAFLKEYAYKDKFKPYGLAPMNRLLFYGASGTGKTYLAKALSNHLKYKMLYIDIAKSLAVGDVAQNIADIFTFANQTGNCLIMLDESDSIAWNRDTDSHEGGDIRRATNSLFQYLDQLNQNNIFVAATNVLHRIDPAFERRFDMKLEFRRPEGSIKTIIKKFLLAGFELRDNLDLSASVIIERRLRLSYYEIKIITERAMKRAIMDGTNIINISDIYNDLAIAMKIKLRFRTDTDDEEIFTSNLHK